ncbi:hypothetical protein HGQ17_08580 [Nesterenkonia sp. MY13]|uniref:ATP-grasp domain-containing protein n=1 Tax=Nesterenkonia sedimenti TaxID=1463632 RepID=A0A7X8TKJ9_9MICC|nr:hypothetical protein [Nesterenkonia sedimenti]NLS10052.1 hypothetical protein [Nesterenkonia sedimenti]
MNDAARPVGQFITEQVLPQWEDLNAYRSVYTHNQAMNVMLNRHGIRTHQFGGSRVAFLYNGSVVGGRQVRLTTLISDQAAEATASKTLSRAYWSSAGLPVIETHRFAQGEDAQASKLICKGRSWVVKLDSARYGRGVSLPVVSKEEFTHAWQKARANLPQDGRVSQELLLEKFYDGINLRFFVIAGQAWAALLRTPLFVLGDGHKTVHQLLEESFEHRRRHVALRRALPEINERLLSPRAPRLTDIPQKGDLHILNEVTNMPRGSLPLDVTREVSEDLKALAEQAAAAIPGLGMTCIDLLTTRLDSATDAVLLDADCRASMGPHRYPAFGRGRRLASVVARQTRLRAEYWDKPIRPAQVRSDDDNEDDD